VLANPLASALFAAVFLSVVFAFFDWFGQFFTCSRKRQFFHIAPHTLLGLIYWCQRQVRVQNIFQRHPLAANTSTAIVVVGTKVCSSVIQMDCRNGKNSLFYQGEKYDMG